jgi:hypothetical protein
MTTTTEDLELTLAELHNTASELRTTLAHQLRGIANAQFHVKELEEELGKPLAKPRFRSAMVGAVEEISSRLQDDQIDEHALEGLLRETDELLDLIELAKGGDDG